MAEGVTDRHSVLFDHEGMASSYLCYRTVQKIQEWWDGDREVQHVPVPGLMGGHKSFRTVRYGMVDLQSCCVIENVHFLVQ